MISFHIGNCFLFLYTVINGHLQHLQRRFLKVFLEAMSVSFGGMLSEPDCYEDTLPYLSFVFSFSWYSGASGYHGSALSPDEPLFGVMISGSNPILSTPRF